MAPHGMVKVYPRQIDLENTERLKSFERTRVVESLAELETAVRRRQKANSRAMAERLLFLTGHLARRGWNGCSPVSVRPRFAWEIVDIGVKVAALMTEEIIARRLKLPVSRRPRHPARPLPRRPRRLGQHFGVPFVRGPDEIADLPAFLGRAGKPPDLSRHDMRIFAEIVDAPALSLDALVQRATTLAAAGADVIDLGCLPETPFPQLAEAVRAMKGQGLTVSVDSANLEELETGAAAGADYLLSLDRKYVSVSPSNMASTPVLIPSNPGDLDSLGRAIEAAQAAGHRLHRRSCSRSDPFRFCRLARPLSSRRAAAGRRSR